MEMRMFRDAGNAAMEFGISIQVSCPPLVFGAQLKD